MKTIKKSLVMTVRDMLLSDAIDMEIETIEEIISDLKEEKIEATESVVYDRAYDAYMCSIDY